VHVQSDRRNASMSQQQAKLQAATFQSQAQLLENWVMTLEGLLQVIPLNITTHFALHSVIPMR